jgi:hypothetical protein
MVLQRDVRACPNRRQGAVLAPLPKGQVTSLSQLHVQTAVSNLADGFGGLRPVAGSAQWGVPPAALIPF